MSTRWRHRGWVTLPHGVYCCNWHSPSNEVSKKESPEVLKALALERIDRHKCTVNIYTDASRDTDNKTSAAFCIPILQVQHKARLSDHLTIFAAELTAIKLALAWVLDHNNVNAVQLLYLGKLSRPKYQQKNKQNHENFTGRCDSA